MADVDGDDDKRRILVDRSLLVSLATPKHAGASGPPRSLDTLASLAGGFEAIVYEMSGLSALEHALRACAGLADKLLGVSPRAILPVSAEEARRLRRTLKEWAARPAMLAALQRFEHERGGPARPP